MTKALYVAGAIVALVSVGCDDDDTTLSTPVANVGLVARTDIVSDQGGAVSTDATLVNAWGLAFNPAGFAWVSSTETGISEVYTANGQHAIPSVRIPGAGGAAAAPTGQVFNGDASAFMGDLFIFVSEDGTISGWQQSFTDLAVMRIDNSGQEASYKGVTIAVGSNGQPRLYAANFHNRTVDVYDRNYQVMNLPPFMDPGLPAGFAPFNVAAVQGRLIVTYALQDQEGEDDVAGAGNGYVDLFDTEGAFLARLISAGELNAPWGVTVAPAGFAAAPGQLLVGNFGDGLTHAYTLNLDARTATFNGALKDANGADLMIDGLWALEFGNGVGGFAADQLYFTAGPAEETHGVFGRLASTSAGNVTTGGTTGNVTTGGTTTGGTTGGTTTGGYMP